MLLDYFLTKLFSFLKKFCLFFKVKVIFIKATFVLRIKLDSFDNYLQ